MNATKNYIGNNKHSRRTKTKTTAQAVGRVRRMDETPERHGRDKKGPKEIGSDVNASNSFLKCTFLPKLKENDFKDSNSEIKLGDSTKTERDFYQSLSLLADHYKIGLMQTKHFGFPYNIAMALKNVQEKLKSEVRNWEEIRLIEEKGKVYFTSEEHYNTGATLYYIPVIPLYRLSKKPRRKQAVQLLQSICSYLYHIVEIPYYRQQSSYLFWMYEMVAEWLTSDDENEETPTCLSEIKQAEQIGDLMEQKIYSHHNLSRFKERLEKFTPKDGFDKDCLTLAGKIFSLYEQYPHESIYHNARANREADEYEGETIVSMDKYISFCAEAKGMMFQSLFDTINCEFQECTTMEEPMVIKKFDGSNITSNNLDFESRLFPLIEELIYILNSF